MQNGTSFVRFVGEHLMRHAEAGRENFPVQSSLLPHATARFLNRALSAAAHVLGLQFFRGDQGAALHQGSRLFMQEVAPSICNALVQTDDFLA